MPQVTRRSRPRGARPGNQGQAKSKQSPAKPNRNVTIPPVGTLWPITLYEEYTAAQKKFMTNRIIKYDGFTSV